MVPTSTQGPFQGDGTGQSSAKPTSSNTAGGLTGLCPLSIHSVAIFCSCQKPSIRVWPASAKLPVSCMDSRRPGSIPSNAIQSNNPAIKYQTAKALDSALRWHSSTMRFSQAWVSRTLTKVTIHEALALKLSTYMKIFFYMYQRLAKYGA